MKDKRLEKWGLGGGAGGGGVEGSGAEGQIQDCQKTAKDGETETEGDRHREANREIFKSRK